MALTIRCGRLRENVLEYDMPSVAIASPSASPPYCERPDAGDPAYIEFRRGDYQHELGIIDSKYAPPGVSAGPGGVIAYWHVDDVAGTLQKLMAMGAKEYEPLTHRGDAGWITASVVDPFGNILGIIYNPHYLEILGSKGTA